ncbi:hypothetical protein H1Q63_17630 [Desmonostoc muscorum CCALA 125]|nr:hypothetical protein [Desmonostoc muscorum CCALA 125]
MRNVDAKRLAAGYRKGRIRVASPREGHKERRSQENLAQPHKEMVSGVRIKNSELKSITPYPKL